MTAITRRQRMLAERDEARRKRGTRAEWKALQDNYNAFYQYHEFPGALEAYIAAREKERKAQEEQLKAKERAHKEYLEVEKLQAEYWKMTLPQYREFKEARVLGLALEDYQKAKNNVDDCRDMNEAIANGLALSDYRLAKEKRLSRGDIRQAHLEDVTIAEYAKHKEEWEKKKEEELRKNTKCGIVKVAAGIAAFCGGAVAGYSGLEAPETYIAAGVVAGSAVTAELADRVDPYGQEEFTHGTINAAAGLFGLVLGAAARFMSR